jgi:heptosyltransferase-2
LRVVADLMTAEGWSPVWFLDPDRPVPPELSAGGDLVIRAPLPEAAQEMARCQVVVAGDTGLAHLAAAVGRPVVAIFASTTPDLGYAPVGRHRVVDVDLPCRPCHVHGAKRCWLGHRRCLTEIDPHTIRRCVLELAGAGRQELEGGEAGP